MGEALLALLADGAERERLCALGLERAAGLHAGSAPRREVDAICREVAAEN